MALPGYKATAVNGSGDTIGSTQVEVRRRSDNALASLFDAATSGSALTNPFNAGSNGDFEFFAAADDYIVTLGSGSSPQVFPLSLINSDYTDDRYAQLAGASFTGNVDTSGKIKIGTGADGNSNANDFVASKDVNNVGMSLLAADTTGVARLYLGSQTDTTAASIRHTESNDRLFVQAKGDLYFQTGGTSNTMTLNTSGDLDVTGALSKGSGSFKIDHPLKPETHHLVHSFLEGPQADNIYRGTVALVGGTATVNLDEAGRMSEGTFVALNGNVQCLTSNEQGWTAVRGSVSGNVLTVEAQDAACTDTVSWMVIGERKDQHMIDTHWTDAAGRVITEPEKPPVEEEDTE